MVPLAQRSSLPAPPQLACRDEPMDFRDETSERKHEALNPALEARKLRR
jgi:hypothetical protein